MRKLNYSSFMAILFLSIPVVVFAGNAGSVSKVGGAVAGVTGIFGVIFGFLGAASKYTKMIKDANEAYRALFKALASAQKLVKEGPDQLYSIPAYREFSRDLDTATEEVADIFGSMKKYEIEHWLRNVITIKDIEGIRARLNATDPILKAANEILSKKRN